MQIAIKLSKHKDLKFWGIGTGPVFSGQVCYDQFKSKQKLDKLDIAVLLPKKRVFMMSRTLQTFLENQKSPHSPDSSLSFEYQMWFKPQNRLEFKRGAKEWVLDNIPLLPVLSPQMRNNHE